MEEPGSRKRSSSSDSSLLETIQAPLRVTSSRRFVVLEVSSEHYVNRKGAKALQKVAKLNNELDGSIHILYLRDTCSTLPVSVGDVINIIGPINKDSTTIQDSLAGSFETDNLVVINPSILISPTAIADSLFCLRRAVLSQRVQRSGNNPTMLIGAMAHTLFERALVFNNFSTDFFNQSIQKIIEENILEM